MKKKQVQRKSASGNFAKLLKGLLIFLLSTVLLMGVVVALILGVWLHPEWVVKEQNLKYVKPMIEAKGYSWTSRGLKLTAKSNSFYRKTVALRAEHLCVNFVDLSPSPCARELKLEVEFDLSGFEVRRLNVHEVSLELDPWSFSPKKQKKTEKSQVNKVSLENVFWIHRVRLGKVQLFIPEIKFFEEDNPRAFYQGSARVLNHPKTGFFVSVSAKHGLNDPLKKLEFEWQGAAVREWEDLSKIEHVVLSAGLSRQRHVDFSLTRMSLAESALDQAWRGQARYRDRFVESSAKFKTKFSKENVSVDLNASLFPDASRLGLKHMSFKRIDLKNCQLHLARATGAEDFLQSVRHLNFRCPFMTKIFIHESRSFLKRMLPENLGFLFAGELKSRDGNEFIGQSDLKILPFKNDFLSGAINARYPMHFFRGKDFEWGKVQTEGHLKLHDFRKLAAFLNALEIMIPSPVNVLEGFVRMDFEGELLLNPFLGDFKTKLRTDLKSPGQQFDLSAAGTARFHPCRPPEDRAMLDFEFVATDLKLQLPGLDYNKLPSLTPDSRFAKTSEILEEGEPLLGCGLGYRVQFKNALDHPLLISGPLLKKPLPIVVNVDAASDLPLKGKISMEKYETELFRRKTTVDFFKLDLASKLLSGRFRVDYTDYRVLINLTGTTQNVRADFESEPPLERQAVLALLLFGRRIEGLDDDQAGSVSNMDAAAKDGALSLASLYLFASTPIESVGYNPHTKGLTAKVKLGNGTSLNLGANEKGLTDVGVSRRLSPRWRVETTVNDPNHREGRSASSLLEWFSRF